LSPSISPFAVADFLLAVSLPIYILFAFPPNPRLFFVSETPSSTILSLLFRFPFSGLWFDVLLFPHPYCGRIFEVALFPFRLPPPTPFHSASRILLRPEVVAKCCSSSIAAPPPTFSPPSALRILPFLPLWSLILATFTNPPRRGRFLLPYSACRNFLCSTLNDFFFFAFCNGFSSAAFLVLLFLACKNLY